MRSAAVTLAVLTCIVSVYLISPTHGGTVAKKVSGDKGRTVRQSRTGYGVPQPNPPALYSAPRSHQEQAAQDLEIDQQSSTDRDGTTTEVYFDGSNNNNNNGGEDGAGTSDDYQFANTGTTPSPQNDYPNSGYTTNNPTEPRVGSEGFSNDVNTQRPLDQQQIENQQYPRRQQIPTLQRLDEYGPPQQYLPQFNNNQDDGPARNSQYLPPVVRGEVTSERSRPTEPFNVPQNEISLPNKGFFGEETTSSRPGGETTQQQARFQGGSDQREENINYNEVQRRDPQQNYYLPPQGRPEQLPQQQGPAAARWTSFNQQDQNNGEDQIWSPQQYYGNGGNFHAQLFQSQQQQQQQQYQVSHQSQQQQQQEGQEQPQYPQPSRYYDYQSRPQQGYQQQLQQLVQGPQNGPQRQPEFFYSQEAGDAYQEPQQDLGQGGGPNQEIFSQGNPQQRGPAVYQQSQQQGSAPYQQPQQEVQAQYRQPQGPIPYQQQTPAQPFQQPQQQSQAQYQQLQQQEQGQYPQPQSKGLFQQTQSQLPAQYQQSQQQGVAPYQQPQVQSPGSYQQPEQNGPFQPSRQEGPNAFRQQSPLQYPQEQGPNQYQAQGGPSYLPPQQQQQGVNQGGQQNFYQGQRQPGGSAQFEQQQPNQGQSQSQQQPTAAQTPQSPPETSGNDGSEFEDPFHNNVVDAELLLRVQKIIEEHERQQKELREKSSSPRRENDYFDDNNNSIQDNQLSNSPNQPSTNQGFYNPNNNFPSNSQSSPAAPQQQYGPGNNRVVEGNRNAYLEPFFQSQQQNPDNYRFPPSANGDFSNNDGVNKEQRNNGEQGPTPFGGQVAISSGSQIPQAPSSFTSSSNNGGREYSNEKSTAIKSAPHIEYQKAILTDHFVETRPEYLAPRSQYLPSPPPSSPLVQPAQQGNSAFISNPQTATFPSPSVSNARSGNQASSNEIVQPENQQFQQQQQQSQQKQDQAIPYNQNRGENLQFPSQNNGQSPIYSSAEGENNLLNSRPVYSPVGNGDGSSQNPQGPLLFSSAYPPQSFPQKNPPAQSFIQYENPTAGSPVEITPGVRGEFVQSPLPQELQQQEQEQQAGPIPNSYALTQQQQQNQRTIIVHEVPHGTVLGATNRALISPNDFNSFTSTESQSSLNGNRESFPPQPPSSNGFPSSSSPPNEDPNLVQDPYVPRFPFSQPQRSEDRSQFPNILNGDANGQGKDSQPGYLPPTESRTPQGQFFLSSAAALYSSNGNNDDIPKPIYGIPLAPVVDPDSLAPSTSSFFSQDRPQNPFTGQAGNDNNNNQFYTSEAYNQQQQPLQEQSYTGVNGYNRQTQQILLAQLDDNNLNEQAQQEPAFVYGQPRSSSQASPWTGGSNSVTPLSAYPLNNAYDGNQDNGFGRNQYGIPSQVSQVGGQGRGYRYPRPHRSIKRLRRIRKPTPAPSLPTAASGEKKETAAR